MCHYVDKKSSHTIMNVFIFLAKDVKQTWNLINKALGRGNNKENIPKYFVSNGHILSNNLDIANGF